MFTCQKSKAVAKVTADNPSGVIGSQSQPLPSEFSPDRNEDRKRPVKLGRGIAKPDVVAVPF
jgi:hypothetical protein